MIHPVLEFTYKLYKYKITPKIYLLSFNSFLISFGTDGTDFIPIPWISYRYNDIDYKVSFYLFWKLENKDKSSIISFLYNIFVNSLLAIVFQVLYIVALLFGLPLNILFIVLWLFVGIILETCKLINIGTVWNLWCYLWRMDDDFWDDDTRIDTAEFNKSILLEIIFESSFQIIIQAVNNSLSPSNSWTSIELTSITFSAFAIISGCYTFVYLRYCRKNGPTSISEIPIELKIEIPFINKIFFSNEEPFVLFKANLEPYKRQFKKDKSNNNNNNIKGISQNHHPSAPVPQEEDYFKPHFVCPITNAIMINPVFTCDGQTYEKDAIEEWLRTNNTSPLTGARLQTKTLTPNHSLRNAIQDYNKKYGEKKMSGIFEMSNVTTICYSED